MNCPQCGAEIPAGAAACPACSAAVAADPAAEAAPAETPAAPAKKQKPPKPPRVRKPSRWTVSDMLGGVPFLIGGGILFVVYLVLFFQSAGPAIGALRELPGLGGFGQLVGTSSVRFYYAPLLLTALYHLTWWLAGMLLMIGGLFSLLRGRGVNQAGSAVTLMFIGFFANLLTLFIVEGDALIVTGHQMQANWTPFLAQALIIAITLVLIQLKVRAKKKQNVQNAALRASVTVHVVEASSGKGKKAKKGKAPKPKKEKAPKEKKGKKK